MVLRKLVRSNYGRKSPVSIKYENLHSFKEGVVLLCQSILERRRMSRLPDSAHFTIPLMRHQEREGNSLFMLKNTFASVQFVMIWKTRRRAWCAFSGSANLVFNIFGRYLTFNYIWTCRLASAAVMKPKTRISLRNIFWEKCPSKRSIKKISSVYIKQIYSNGYLLQMFSSYFQTPKGIVQKYIKQAKKSSSAICFPLDFENWKSIESIWQNLLRDSQL